MANFKALLCSSDSATLACFQSALGEFDFDCIDLAEFRRIVDLANSEHFDLIVVDAEQLLNGIVLIQEIRESRANRDSVTFGIGGPANWERMLQNGASVVIEKPIVPDAIRRKLREAREVIENEHRRYNRQPVTLPIEIRLPDGTTLQGESANNSEGGMAAQLAQDPAQHELVTLCFRLPGEVEPLTLEAKLAWVDTDLRAGFRFLRLARENRTVLSDFCPSPPTNNFGGAHWLAQQPITPPCDLSHRLGSGIGLLFVVVHLRVQPATQISNAVGMTKATVPGVSHASSTECVEGTREV